MKYISKILDWKWYQRKVFNIVYWLAPKHKRLLINRLYQSSLVYEHYFHKPFNFIHPRDLAEKLIWLSLFWNDSKKVVCADKYRMRDYVTKEKHLPSDILIPLIGVYHHADEIDYNQLPASFVLTCNHGSGFNILVPNKSMLNIEETNKKLEYWVNSDYYGSGAEFHYLDIREHVIMCQEFLHADGELINPNDIKIYVVNGQPRWIIYAYNRYQGKHVEYASFSIDWKQLFLQKDEKGINIERPKSLTRMLEYAKILGEDFPFLRVDFYEINGKLYLGELTISPAGNVDNDYLPEQNKILGKSLHLPRRCF